MSTTTAAVSRALLGEPLRTDRMDETLLPKRLALPVFCSDPLSSVAYATEQIVLVLGLGGLALLDLTPWVALGVVLLLDATGTLHLRLAVIVPVAAFICGATLLAIGLTRRD